MSARFSQIIKAAGRPETYLALIDPAKDKTLQKLVKASRVMTVHQNARGGKPDYGEVGFEEGPSRQFLIFPKSLKRFAGKHIVGIKYDLLKDAPAPGARKKSPPREKPKPARKPAKKTKPPKPAPKEKIIAFPTPEKEDEDDPEIRDIKARIRKAMKALEAGKQVAAFNLLQRIVD